MSGARQSRLRRAVTGAAGWEGGCLCLPAVCLRAAAVRGTPVTCPVAVLARVRRVPAPPPLLRVTNLLFRAGGRERDARAGARTRNRAAPTASPGAPPNPRGGRACPPQAGGAEHRSGRSAAAPQAPHRHPGPGRGEGPGPDRPRGHRGRTEHEVRRRHHRYGIGELPMVPADGRTSTLGLDEPTRPGSEAGAGRRAGCRRRGTSEEAGAERVVIGLAIGVPGRSIHAATAWRAAARPECVRAQTCWSPLWRPRPRPKRSETAGIRLSPSAGRSRPKT